LGYRNINISGDLRAVYKKGDIAFLLILETITTYINNFWNNIFRKNGRELN